MPAKSPNTAINPPTSQGKLGSCVDDRQTDLGIEAPSRSLKTTKELKALQNEKMKLIEAKDKTKETEEKIQYLDERMTGNL